MTPSRGTRGGTTRSRSGSSCRSPSRSRIPRSGSRRRARPRSPAPPARASAGAAARWYLGDNEAPLNRVRFGPDFDRTRFAKYTDDALIRDRMVVGGDPDTCSRVVESWATVGVDQLILMIQAGETSHDDVMRAIELLGTKVLPRFQDPT